MKPPLYPMPVYVRERIDDAKFHADQLQALLACPQPDMMEWRQVVSLTVAGIQKAVTAIGIPQNFDYDPLE